MNAPSGLSFQFDEGLRGRTARVSFEKVQAAAHQGAFASCMCTDGRRRTEVSGHSVSNSDLYGVTLSLIKLSRKQTDYGSLDDS